MTTAAVHRPVRAILIPKSIGLEMAETAEEKSRGLKFAEQQLLRHGWEQGKGLGRDENGVTEAIKVKVKCDKGGVGHHQGEQFTFHWWDHVFNKASSNLVVESGQDGVQVKKVAGEGEEGMISNKKPRKAELAKAKLYGHFVKSGTLWSGEEQAEKSSSSEDGSESEDEDRKLDLSSTTKLSDEDLVKACGGRTAHKGARHGLTMTAKLARLEKQELEFLAKYGKKGQPAVTSSRETVTNLAARSPKGEDTEREGSKRKKKKKRSEDKVEKMVAEDAGSATLPETDIPQKKREHSKEKHSVVEEQSSILSSNKKGQKKKKRANTEGGGNCDSNCEVKEANGKEGSKSGENAFREEGGESDMIPVVNDIIPKKKKKRSKKKEEASVGEEGECASGTESNVTETVPKKKKKANKTTDTPELEQEVEENMQPGQKRKKNGTCKGEEEKVEDGGRDETRRVKKKRKSLKPGHD
ncbi:hypothetical protein AAFF_G00426650 [Aldrovandia affinis]|uniref:G patch domain-containing protein 4 n=1 Tax=Aldrovandia affinis TaxID=143900 RepID=A0AAD7S9F7_9TELE|nr:hypothetical protein AAFF_G00426650 [Aldrovandia affinis]